MIDGCSKRVHQHYKKRILVEGSKLGDHKLKMLLKSYLVTKRKKKQGERSCLYDSEYKRKRKTLHN